MESGKMAKQMVNFQKTLFNNTFDAIIMLQDQTEKIANSFIERLTWVPEDGRKSYVNSIEMYKKARGDFKKAVDEGFDKLDGMFSAKE